MKNTLALDICARETEQLNLHEMLSISQQSQNHAI